MQSAFVPPSIQSLAEIDPIATYGSDLRVIEGMVSVAGQCGWPGPKGGYKVHCFELAAWRFVGRELNEQQVTVLRPVPLGHEYFSDYQPYSILTLEVLMSKDCTRAVLSRVLPFEGDDAAFVKVANELRVPKMVTTRELGRLLLDRATESWSTKKKWNGKMVKVRFRDCGDDLGGIRNVARELWAQQTDWKRKYEERAIHELLAMKNRFWLGDGESETTATELLNALKLETIALENDGDIEFVFTCGDLFAGHYVVATANVRDGITQMTISG